MGCGKQLWIKLAFHEIYHSMREKILVIINYFNIESVGKTKQKMFPKCLCIMTIKEIDIKTNNVIVIQRYMYNKSDAMYKHRLSFSNVISMYDNFLSFLAIFIFL